ncbi:hypothetical protein [Euzebya tangerina]|uniref:hypothetical protein n=1 Tax=Euzebya tangerina TaxID=591198 RepID=UPI000E3102DF|nr:hypothetical protein [Euzebya tangerina]
MRIRKSIIIVSIAALLAALAATAVLARPSAGGRSLDVEVAEIGARFVFDPDVVDEDGVPLRGNDFVTEGYVYEAGTLTCTDGVCDGVIYDEDGTPSPEFPDRLIGSWTCWGTHTEDAATTTSGDIVATTQVYDFEEELGEESVVTTGFERADDVPIDRAIVGGTGRPGIDRGVATQSFQGLNNAETVIDGAPVFGVTLFVELNRAG